MGRPKQIAYTPLPTCPHCGGLHFGQRFDDCPYVKLANDPEASIEARANAAGILAMFKKQSPKSIKV